MYEEEYGDYYDGYNALYNEEYVSLESWEHQCPWCKKVFIICDCDLWVYKINSAYCCSWKCKRELERDRKAHLHMVNGVQQVVLTCDGESLTMKEWAKRLGIPLTFIKWRYGKGLSDEECLHGERGGEND